MHSITCHLSVRSQDKALDKLTKKEQTVAEAKKDKAQTKTSEARAKRDVQKKKVNDVREMLQSALKSLMEACEGELKMLLCDLALSTELRMFSL